MIAFLYSHHKATRSRISHNDRVGKRLQDTASWWHDCCTCMSLDFTATAVAWYEHEGKEEEKNYVCKASTPCTSLKSCCLKNLTTFITARKGKRVCKSLLFLRSRADYTVSVLPQANSIETELMDPGRIHVSSSHLTVFNGKQEE